MSGSVVEREAALDALVAEAAAARAARSLERCVEALERPLETGDPAALAAAAPVARALWGLERLATGPVPAELDAGPLLERIATAHLVASDGLSLLHTRIPALPATARVTRCLIAVVCDLLHAAERCAAPGPDGAEASLVVVTSDAFITVAVVISDRPALLVPSGGAAEVIARLGRLAEVCGGTVRRRVRPGGGVEVGVALAVRTRPL